MNKEVKEEYGFKILTPRSGYYITQASVEHEEERWFAESVAMAIDADESAYTEWTTAQKNAWERRYAPNEE